MGQHIDLESLRTMFEDRKTYIAVGKVLKLGLATDRSVLRAECQMLSQDRNVVARVCWDACGPNSGSFQFPQVGDLVLLEFAEGDDNQVYLTKRLSNQTDKIPTQATGSHMVHKALAGKKLYLASDTQILIGLGATADPAQPLVLGTVLQTLLVTVLQALSTQSGALSQLALNLKTVTDSLATVSTDLATHLHTSGAPGLPTSAPATAATYTTAAAVFSTGSTNMTTAKTAMDAAQTTYNAQKASPVEDDAVLSDLAFTEKGS